MMKTLRTSILFTSLLAIFALAGCGQKTNPIAAFEPEIVNNADAFQFQITDASRVTTTLNYTWTNSGSQATVDHSTATTAGSAAITVFDADGTQVYTSSLLASGVQQTTVGTTGVWTVRVVFANFSGTANFTAEKL